MTMHLITLMLKADSSKMLLGFEWFLFSHKSQRLYQLLLKKKKQNLTWDYKYTYPNLALYNALQTYHVTYN